MTNKEVLDSIFGEHSEIEYANHNRQSCHDCLLNSQCGKGSDSFNGCLHMWESWLEKESFQEN